MSYVKTQYRFSQNLKPEVLDWYDLHFPTSSFHGRLHVGRRKNDGFGVQRLFTGEREAVREFLETMHVSSKIDYYITANKVSGVDRKLDGLFSLDNIVLDLDCHDSSIDEETLDSLLWRFRRDQVVPMPNSIVHTGRGLQFWWHIKPVHAKCRPFFEEVRDYIFDRIVTFLQEYSEFEGLKLDATASHNLIGYYRLPGTVNTATGTVVEYEIERQESYILQDMTDWVALEKETSKKNREAPPPTPTATEDFSGRYQASDIRILKNFHTFGFTRMRQLIQLRILRDNEIGEETRNDLCFMAYNAMLPGLGHDKAFERLLEFNQGFKSPMSEKELNGVICSAKDKGGYKYSNAKMIEFLGVTSAEQEAIGLWAPTKQFDPMTRLSTHPSRTAARRTIKADRDKKVISLAENGLKAAAIARELDIDRHTVASILHKAGFDRHKAVMDALDSGMSIEETAKSNGLSTRTVKNLKSEKMVKNGPLYDCFIGDLG